MRTVQREIVAALIYSRDNKLFMGRKDPKDGGVYIDCWHIPGGGIDEGEDKISALVREIKEEVGVDISEEKIELIDDEGCGMSEKMLKEIGEKVMCEMHFNVYQVNLDTNAGEVKVILSDDLIECKWFNTNELAGIKLTPPSVKLFTKLKLI